LASDDLTEMTMNTATTTSAPTGEKVAADTGAIIASSTPALGQTAASTKQRKPRLAKDHRTEGKVAAGTTDAGTSAVTKTELVLKKLRTPRGTTIQALMEATGWQAHSVRGFLSGTVRKKLGLILMSEAGRDGVRRYRIQA